MPDAAFLTRLGIFVDESFLTEELCHEICAAAATAPRKAGEVRTTDDNSGVDRSVRDAYGVGLLDEHRKQIDARLHTAMPNIAEHFQVELRNHQAPWLIAYPVGGFYGAHRDVPEVPVGGDDEFVQATMRRKVSVVLFLNDQCNDQREKSAVQDGMFAGGSLIFYDLLNDPRGK